MKRKIQIKSNPKTYEQYLEMFTKVLAVEENLRLGEQEIRNFVKDDAPKGDFVCDNKTIIKESWWPERFTGMIDSCFPDIIMNDDLTSEISRIIVKAEDHLETNSRIETFLKWYRAKAAFRLLSNYKTLDDTANSNENINGGHITRWLRMLIKSSHEDIKVLSKIVEQYRKNAREDMGIPDINHELRQDADDMLMHLKHFVDTYKSDKQVFREIGDYSWVGKPMFQISNELALIESRIRENSAESKAMYQQKYNNAAPTKMFLRINDNMAWYLINEDFCPFEAYLGGHCGSGSDGETAFFSLRTLNKETKMFKSHLTVSARGWRIPKESSHYSIRKIVYEIFQIKGHKNSEAPIELWPALFELFEHSLIGWQSTASYGSELDFKPHWVDMFVRSPKDFEADKTKWHDLATDLVARKEHLYKVKPWFSDQIAAFKNYDVLLGEFRDYFQQRYKAKIYLTKEGDLELVWPSYYEMLEELKDWDDKFEEALNPEYEYYDSSYNDVEFSDYEYIIKKKYKYVWNLLKKYAKEDFGDETKVGDLFGRRSKSDRPLVKAIQNAMNHANADGWQAGGESAKYDAYKSHLDGLKLKNSEGQHFATINQRTDLELTQPYDQMKWGVTFHFNELLEYYNREGDIGHYYPKFNKGSSRYSDYTDWDFEWETDFDSDVAQERFPDALYEEGIREHDDPKREPTDWVDDE